MNYFTIFALSFTIALSGALAPGPLLAAVISKSPSHGAKTGPLLILGHAVVELVMVTLIALGFARILNNSAALKAIAVSGAALLVYFGVSLLLSLKKTTLVSSGAKGKSSRLTMLGITLSVSNPYWAIWWLTIGMGMVLAAQKQGLPGIIVFFLGHIAADLGWYSFVSFSLSRNASRINLKVYKGILFACAILLIGFGILFAWYAMAGINHTING